ncbi:MAG: hypothetical protein M0Z54_09225 [Thermaerobacter sp.]|nr:hypothetical protein [Thermaerobacter sp.]
MMIFTSNLASDVILEEADAARRRQLVMEEVGAAFRPEWLNRLDGVVLFERRELDHVRAETQRQIQEVAGRLAGQGWRSRSTTRRSPGWFVADSARPTGPGRFAT